MATMALLRKTKHKWHWYPVTPEQWRYLATDAGQDVQWLETRGHDSDEGAETDGQWLEEERRRHAHLLLQAKYLPPGEWRAT